MILVTGGAGYIGSHTCIELLNAGYEIAVIDNFSNSKIESLHRVQRITGKTIKIYSYDLKNTSEVQQVFEENQIEAVIHLAGLKAVGESVLNPLKYYETNIGSTIVLCQVMKQFGVKKLVFSSSATVYGASETVPISEESPLHALNPYGRTKLIIEEMLKDLYLSDLDWSISLLRYFNPIGAHESGLIGEDPNGIQNNLMPYITKVAVGELKTLYVFGNKFPTIDGTGVRDYIHVVDLGKGHVAALEKALKTSGIEAYNLGTGKGYSVLQVIEAFETVNKVNIPYIITAPRAGDTAFSFADPTKAKRKLNWQTEKDLIEMCQDSWRWQFNNPKGYQENTIEMNPRKVQSEVFLVNK